MLEQLHTELQRADTIDDRSRELLRSVLGDIEDLLERKQKVGTEPESIIEQLREAVRAFETTHPTLTSAVGSGRARRNRHIAAPRARVHSPHSGALGREPQPSVLNPIFLTQPRGTT